MLSVSLNKTFLSLSLIQAIEQKIANYQPSIASLNQSVEPLRSAGQVSNADEILHLTSQYELLIDQVTQQLARCRQATVARQQFHAQLEEMEMTVLDCENQIEAVTDLGVSIPARIEKYTVCNIECMSFSGF